MKSLFQEKKDIVETYIKKGRQTNLKNTSFLANLSIKFSKFKQKLMNDPIEETKKERSEVKNFNRNNQAKRAEIETSTRMFMFVR